MRIQETNSILKESRHARHSAALQSGDRGMLSRAWQMVQRLFSRSNQNGGRP